MVLYDFSMIVDANLFPIANGIILEIQTYRLL